MIFGSESGPLAQAFSAALRSKAPATHRREYGCAGREWYFGSELAQSPMYRRLEAWGHALEAPTMVRANAGATATARVLVRPAH